MKYIFGPPGIKMNHPFETGIIKNFFSPQDVLIASQKNKKPQNFKDSSEI